MLARGYEAKSEGSLTLYNTLGDETTRAGIVESLKTAGETSKHGNIGQHIVLVLTQHTHIGKNERGSAPEQSCIVDHDVAADSVREIATRDLGHWIAVEETRQQGRHLSLVIVKLFGNI